MDINTDQPLKALKTQILEYIELKTDHTRLSLVEYVAKITSYIFTAIIGIIIISFVFLLLFVVISFFIGQWLHSYGLGFLISAGIYMLIFWYFATIGRRQVQNYMIRKIVDLISSSSKTE